jgi:hypothetical protein
LLLSVLSAALFQATSVWAQASSAITRSQTNVAASAIAQQIREATRRDREARADTTLDTAAASQSSSADKTRPEEPSDANHQSK